MKLRILFITLVSIIFFSCNAQTNKDVKLVDAKEFSTEIKSDDSPQILDVRTPQEFNEQHIANATNIDWNGSTFEQQAQYLDKDKTVYVYCKSGGRSAKASSKLAEMGFKDIVELDGGITKWNDAGMDKQ